MARTLKDVKVVGDEDKTTVQLSMRVKQDMRDLLDDIAKYLHANGTVEMVRGWTLDRASQFQNDQRFLAWRREEIRQRERERAQDVL
jgi:uncharacterized protein (DUF1778 family)